MPSWARFASSAIPARHWFHHLDRESSRDADGSLLV
jgi:hypothetical protein